MTSFVKLARHDAAVAKAEAERLEKERIAQLRRDVKAGLPKHLLRVPKRGRGRGATGGISRREAALLEVEATEYLTTGETGIAKLRAKIKLKAVQMLLIDGIMGTEPWRAGTGIHAPLIAANARLRYLDNAIRILNDIGGGKVEPGKALTEGVFDAELAGEGGKK